MATEGVIFDFDGVLVDSERGIAEVWVEGLKEFGVTFTVDEFAAEFTGRSDADCDRILATLIGERRAQEANSRIKMTEQALLEAAPAMPGMAELALH